MKIADKALFQKHVKRHKIIVIILFSFTIGAFAGYGYHSYSTNRIKSHWIITQNIPTKGDGCSVGYSTEAFQAEIPLPSIKKFDVKTKFIKPKTYIKGKASLGYIVKVSVGGLDPNDIPDRYKKELKIGKFTIEPLKEVVYEVHIEFKLYDSDGFELIKLSGPEHNLNSGQTNIFQDIAKELIPIDLMNRCIKIKPYMHIDRCLSCWTPIE
jgi:hypothetical protein